MVHAVVEHRVQAAVQHRDHAHRQAQQEPALRVAGLPAGHQRPQQAAGQRQRRSGTVARGLQVAGQVGQGQPGGYQHQPERAEKYSRHR